MALIWRMTKSLRGTGKTVIMNSGFCVLKGLIGMCKIGVYISPGAKKPRYWPSGIYGDKIINHNEKEETGENKCY